MEVKAHIMLLLHLHLKLIVFRQLKQAKKIFPLRGDKFDKIRLRFLFIFDFEKKKAKKLMPLDVTHVLTRFIIWDKN